MRSIVAVICTLIVVGNAPQAIFPQESSSKMAIFMPSSNFPNGTRLEALIICNDNVLLMHRKHRGEEYYVLPGGGWEMPETFEEGVIRKVMEETSIQVSVERREITASEFRKK